VSLAQRVLQKVAGVAGQQRVEQRVARMSSDDLVDWLDPAIAGVGRAFAEWRSGGTASGFDHLGEARMGTASVLLVFEELERRRVNGQL
jgi:hypothetical protein